MRVRDGERPKVTVEFYNGAEVYLMPYKTIPAGRTDAEEWKIATSV
ncbi:hypothetical protein [Spongiactinospora gelatinilytica]|nr:hypothetical protein [Spongiactinospora gelatinilytica]